MKKSALKSWQRLFVAGIVLLILPTLAHGWWRWGVFHRGGYYRTAYYGSYYGGLYYPDSYFPVTYAPSHAVYPAACGASLPVAVAPATHATPRAAPPSQTDEPPTASTKKGPTITESRSLGGTYPAMDEKAGTLQVGFWNITGKDVNLKVNGQSHVVPRNRTLNLRLDRNFTWQAGNSEAKQEQVADKQTAHEVILR